MLRVRNLVMLTKMSDCEEQLQTVDYHMLGAYCHVLIFPLFWNACYIVL